MSDTTVPAPAPGYQAPAITDCNLYVLIAMGAPIDALKSPPLPTRLRKVRKNA